MKALGTKSHRPFLFVFRILEQSKTGGKATKRYEAKIEESEKAGSRRESNPGHLACAAMTTGAVVNVAPSSVLTAHTGWLLGVRLRHFGNKEFR